MIRCLILMLCFLMFTQPVGLSYAAPEELKANSAGANTTSDGRLYTLINVDIFGTGNPVDVYFFDYVTPKPIDLPIYQRLLASFKTKNTASYRFYKAHLRDNKHEEIIGINWMGRYFHTDDLFIIGANERGEILSLESLKIQKSR